MSGTLEISNDRFFFDPNAVGRAMTAGGSRSEELDAIRGIAIGLVLAWHILEPWVQQNLAPGWRWILALSWSGVDLFFVLSGFLIGGILLDNRLSQNFFSTFYARRALRILPLYVLLLVAWSTLNHETSIIAYVTFTQNFVWASQGNWGPNWMGPTWSLAVEEQFYVLLPLLVALVPPRNLPRLLILLICVSPAARLVLRYVYGNHFAPYLLLPGRMDPLFFGVLAACLVRNADALSWINNNRMKLTSAAAVLCAILVAFSIFRPSWFGTVMYGVGFSCIASFYFLIVLLVASRSSQRLPRILKPLSWMGIGAYSLYLFHLPVLEFAQWATPTHSIIVTFILLFIFSFVLWHVIEKPLIFYGRDMFKYGRPVAPAVASECS